MSLINLGSFGGGRRWPVSGQVLSGEEKGKASACFTVPLPRMPVFGEALNGVKQLTKTLDPFRGEAGVISDVVAVKVHVIDLWKLCVKVRIKLS